VTEYLPQAEVTVDWFHIVQTFTKRLDDVRKKERREQGKATLDPEGSDA
tara:strand:+ start:396 stop:542 length:147 start_codon:yes stop_codon:yes gene_type:complete